MQNIELEDMRVMIHGLKMSGLAFVETDALDPINDRIKNLPSAEELILMYQNPRDVERICAEVGRIMELIDYYGTKNAEYKSRYKAKTKLPPRYKNLEWKKAGTKIMRIKKLAQDLPQASTEMEAMVQQTKDIELQLQQTTDDLSRFSSQINQDLPNLQAQMPVQYQPIFQQYSVVVVDATNRLLQTSNMLLQNINTLQQSTEGVGQVLESTQIQVENFMANQATSYVTGLVKLSSNLEGNGIISEKLLTYAKNLRDNNPQAAYDAREIELLLRHANFTKEADILMKTAWQMPWSKKKKEAPQAGGYPDKPGYGLIDPGKQEGKEWQTGDVSSQFTNDVNWLERSWEKLVEFFGRYVRDAEILSKEWAENADASDDQKNKIEELKTQANTFLAQAKDFLASGNFSEKIMGEDFGWGGDTDPVTPDPVTPTPVDPKTDPTKLQILAPFIEGDWDKVNWVKVMEMLDEIEQWQRDKGTFSAKSSFNAAMKKLAQQTSAEKWAAVGVRPDNPSLQGFLSGTWGVVDVTELREIVKKIMTKIGAKLPEPTPDPVTPDPVTPDPVTPDPVTPDPVTPDSTGNATLSDTEFKISHNEKNYSFPRGSKSYEAIYQEVQRASSSTGTNWINTPFSANVQQIDWKGKAVSRGSAIDTVIKSGYKFMLKLNMVLGEDELDLFLPLDDGTKALYDAYNGDSVQPDPTTGLSDGLKESLNKYLSGMSTLTVPEVEEVIEYLKERELSAEANSSNLVVTASEEEGRDLQFDVAELIKKMVAGDDLSKTGIQKLRMHFENVLSQLTAKPVAPEENKGPQALPFDAAAALREKMEQNVFEGNKGQVLESLKFLRQQDDFQKFLNMDLSSLEAFVERVEALKKSDEFKFYKNQPTTAFNLKNHFIKVSMSQRDFTILHNTLDAAIEAIETDPAKLLNVDLTSIHYLIDQVANAKSSMPPNQKQIGATPAPPAPKQIGLDKNKLPPFQNYQGATKPPVQNPPKQLGANTDSKKKSVEDEDEGWVPDSIHKSLDWLGFVDVYGIGTASDLGNAVLYLTEGEKAKTVEYLFYAIPLVKWLAKGFKFVGKPILKRVLRSPKLGKKAKEAIGGLMKHADWIEKLPQEIDEVFKKHDITKRDLVDTIRDLGRMANESESAPKTV
jgi:hypothetical protein